MFLIVTNETEFLPTDVTCEPGSFIVWLQQMSFELVRPHEAVWAVSTWVWLCTSVNTGMALQVVLRCKWLHALLTVVRCFPVTVALQVAGCAESFVTQWTLVWFVSCVQSHVLSQMSRLNECLVTEVAFVRFLSTVNSAVHNKVTWSSETSATNSTFKLLLCKMTLPVLQLVTVQSYFWVKPFVTDCAEIRSWLVIIRTLSDVITISFSVNFNTTFTCLTFISPDIKHWLTLNIHLTLIRDVDCTTCG